MCYDYIICSVGDGRGIKHAIHREYHLHHEEHSGNEG